MPRAARRPFGRRACASPLADAVDLGSSLARLGHETVAGLSLGVLAAIPVTRRRARRFRARHDRLTETIYGAIGAATDAVRGGTGEQDPSADQADRAARGVDRS